jgi:phosphonate transport system permease protein
MIARPAVDVDVARMLAPEAFTRPLAGRLRRAAAWTAFVAVFTLGLWHMEVSPGRLLSGLARLGWLVTLMLPPSHGGWLAEFTGAMLETVAMAFAGTAMAAVVALPLGFLGARNVVPVRVLHFGFRRVSDGLRGVDTLIWALMFVNAVGLGPFAGVMAIAVSDAGTLGKLFAEAVENVSRSPIDGVRAAGGTRLHVIRFAILPQVFPVLLSHVLYYLESNTRAATILGVVGAGGIGFQLAERIRLNNWNEVAFIVLMILAAVTAIDACSNAVRLRVIRGSA